MICGWEDNRQVLHSKLLAHVPSLRRQFWELIIGLWMQYISCILHYIYNLHQQSQLFTDNILFIMFWIAAQAFSVAYLSFRRWPHPPNISLLLMINSSGWIESRLVPFPRCRISYTCACRRTMWSASSPVKLIYAFGKSFHFLTSFSVISSRRFLKRNAHTRGVWSITNLGQ